MHAIQFFHYCNIIRMQASWNYMIFIVMDNGNEEQILRILDGKPFELHFWSATVQ